MTKPPEIVFIYNPVFLNKHPGIRLTDVLEKIRRFGFSVEAFPIQQGEAWKDDPGFLLQDAAALVVAGGDGSLNMAVNALLASSNEGALQPMPPIGIIPWGTANDFAGYLGGGQAYTLEQLLQSIAGRKLLPVDVGQVNGSYFMNVAGGGLLVDIAHKTSVTLKKKMGMLAYYLEGARKFPLYRPFPLYLKTGSFEEEMEVYLFLVLNSKTAGGFRQIAPHASINDGKLDIVIIKKTSPIPGLLNIFAKALEGKHLHDPYILYLQADQLELHGPAALETDIDGEKGPSFPLSFRVLRRRLQFYYIDSSLLQYDNSGSTVTDYPA